MLGRIIEIVGVIVLISSLVICILGSFGVDVILINPYNTSKIGKQKYSNQRKLSVHQAAAYVIARRGQGFKDELHAA